MAYIGRGSFEKGIDILRDIEQKINGKVVYCTNVKWAEAMKILKESCILIVPSRMESIPQTIKEAFYLKTPVIATKVGGIPEIIEHGKNGILVSSNNPQELVFAINELLTNKTKRDDLASNAYEYIIKNFSWDVLLKKYVDLYEN